MSRKAALAGVPAGGGKAVIIDHPTLHRRKAYERLGQTIDRWEGHFYTGPDVGTVQMPSRLSRATTRK